MEASLQALEAELNRNTSVDDSAVMAIEKLLAEVETNKNSPQRIQAVVDAWRASTDKVAAAVANTTGTPPEPTP
jgi:hypothetical protein